MTERILQQLETACLGIDSIAPILSIYGLGELAKRALRWPKNQSNTSTCSHYSRDGVCKVPIAGHETRVLEEDGEGWCWSGCSCYA